MSNDFKDQKTTWLDIAVVVGLGLLLIVSLVIVIFPKGLLK